MCFRPVRVGLKLECLASFKSIPLLVPSYNMHKAISYYTIVNDHKGDLVYNSFNIMKTIIYLHIQDK